MAPVCATLASLRASPLGMAAGAATALALQWPAFHALRTRTEHLEEAAQSQRPI